MKKIGLLLLSISPVLNAQEVKPFQETFYLISNKCVSTIVEMNSGDLKSHPGDGFSAICEPIKNKSEFKCTYLYDKSQKPKEVVYSGGIIGSEAVIVMKNIESYNINMVTKNFQSDSYIYLDNGRIRGMKICSGHFIYASDAERITKKKK